MLNYAIRSAILAPLCMLTVHAAAAPAGNEPGSSESATEPQLSVEHRMKLRCSAAFALVAARQAAGDEAALRHPPLATRGKEYFVIASAEVMDAAKLDRAGINAMLTHEALDLVDKGTIEAIMPACLQSLAASGL